MDHIAIMKKSWKLIPKILSGEKTIESRWYMAKFAPWNRIQAGDNVYFKDGGCPITAKAEVEKVLQFANFSGEELKDILKKFGGKYGIYFHKPFDDVFAWAKGKKYCLLIFLKNPSTIEPFEIDKTGFGNACAWLCVEDIDSMRKFVLQIWLLSLYSLKIIVFACIIRANIIALI